MEEIAVCPKSPQHKEFITGTYVSQDVVVDEHGNYIQDYGMHGENVLHGPDKDNTWACRTCFADAVFEKPPEVISIRGVNYTNPDHMQFIKDVLLRGSNVEMYHGRNLWYGPAVRCASISHVAALGTLVPVQYESMGKGLIVYPIESDLNLEK